MTGRLDTPTLGPQKELHLRELAAETWADWKWASVELGVENFMDFLAGVWTQIARTSPELNTDACRNRFERLLMIWSNQ